MDYHKKRRVLVEEFIKPQGEFDKKLLQAFLQVPRHMFVLSTLRKDAYLDTALPIGEGQTISQPSLVATMVSCLGLKGSERVLEVGTGSGYQAAILSKLAKEVYTVEIIKKLAVRARKVLNKLGCKNVHVVLGNGAVGLLKHAPYDAIIVSAAAREIPRPLVLQLKEGGRIVIPIGKTTHDQKLIFGVKKEGKLETVEIEGVRFVPLV